MFDFTIHKLDLTGREENKNACKNVTQHLKDTDIKF